MQYVPAMADVSNEPLKFCVYTTVIGAYEELNEQPAAKSTSIPFICLSDDAALRSDTWLIRRVEPMLAMDPVRSQRALKLSPHRYLAEYDCSLYIDNSVVLRAPPERLIEQFRVAEGIALSFNTLRETVLDEFLEVSTLGFDDQSRIFEQLNHYNFAHPAVLKERPYWTGLLLRDHRNARVRGMLDYWLGHVLRYSRRDQLSVNLAFRQTGLKPQLLPTDSIAPLYSWPRAEGRNRTRGPRAPVVAFAPLPARLRHAEQQLDIAEQTIAAIRKSTSWRMTAPLRAMMRGLRSRGGRPPAIAAFAPGHSRPADASMRNGKAAPHAARFHVDPWDKRGHALLQHNGNVNPPTLAVWRRLLAERAWTHVVDVGANYGEMLIGAPAPSAARVIAVEPNPLIAPYLEWNLAEHGVTAEIVRSAVSDRAGAAALCIDRNWSGKTSLASGGDAAAEAGESLTVETTTLSDLLGGPAAAPAIRALIKIDIEGFEPQALAGMTDMLDGLADFAALVEVLHLPEAAQTWIADRFAIELFETAADRLVPVAPASAEELSSLLADGKFYGQDVVLRRKRVTG
jgi:FkbM family methyltransferase